jgi:polysaccharide export outer membrane protein
MQKFVSKKAGLHLPFPLYFLLPFFLASCSGTKRIAYFNKIGDTQIKTANYNIEPVIQPNDLLSIVVTSANPEASSVFNAPNEATITTGSPASGTATMTTGYLVNVNGDIQFPVLGTIHAAGQNKSQLNSLLIQKINEKKLLVDPIVSIRDLNFRISVLGEVARPGVFNTPNEKLSLLEALSFAGDLTIYGNRENVLLIRENDKGEKLIKRLDLTSQDILTSPYYYLRSNDVIYVEPVMNRIAKEKHVQVIPLVTSVISLIIISITSFRR